MDITEGLKKVVEGQDLTEDEAQACMESIMSGEATLKMTERDDGTWDGVLVAHVDGEGAKDFMAEVHTRNPRATTAACITWAKAVIAGLDVGGNIPNDKKSWSAQSKNSSGDLEDGEKRPVIKRPFSEGRFLFVSMVTLPKWYSSNILGWWG